MESNSRKRPLCAAGREWARRVTGWFAWVVLAGFATAVPGLFAATDAAGRTVVVANENVADSVALAEYYMERREIPAENLYLVRAPRGETVRWDQFVESIFNPLKQKLIEDRWLAGTVGDRTDPDGRLLHTVSGHRIENLVLCYGVPLRIRHDDDRLPEAIRQNIPEPLRTNRGAVDSELALMPHTAYDINAYQRNPLYEKRFPEPADRALMIRVARLDGPTVDAARNLVDSALEGERRGLRGRAYIDLGGPHPQGDEWLERTARRIEELGFDLSVSDSGESLEAASRFDAPALYFGWYAPNVSGPFTVSDFRFPPGAVAMHIHSFSASTVRSADERWVGPFVARGVAGTLGNVYEPYLELTHRPHYFFEALMRGSTLAEAAAYSLPVLSWQGILIGDPLYRPFATGLEAQLRRDSENERDSLSQYAVMRRMNLLERSGDLEGAIAFGEAAYRDDPRIPLALALARLHAGNGDPDTARERLAFVDGLDGVAEVQAGVLMEIIDFLREIGARELALAGARRLVEETAFADEIRRRALRQGATLARESGERRLARRWETERERIGPP